MRMQPIFIFLAAVSFAFLGYTFWLGFSRHERMAELDERRQKGQVIAEAEEEAVSLLIGKHFVWGMGSGVFVCFVHTIVLVYFLGTGKAIKEQMELQNWDSTDHDTSKKLMAKAVVPSVIGVALVVAAAFAGGFTLISVLSPETHLAIAGFAIFGELPVFARQLQIIRENGRLMDRVLEKLDGPNVRIAL